MLPAELFSTIFDYLFVGGDVSRNFEVWVMLAIIAGHTRFGLKMVFLWNVVFDVVARFGV